VAFDLFAVLEDEGLEEPLEKIPRSGLKPDV
jgi:hypothetical protein